MSRIFAPCASGIGIVLLAGTALAASDPAAAPPFVVPVSPDGVQRTTVILDSYSYQPNHLVVEAGKPVELTLTSVTTITPHNFIIKDLAPGLSVEQDVSAGKTATVKFTPPQRGFYTIYCDKRLWPMPSHRDKGMEGALEVR
ncbi:cupredoxin domain-containing protein [Nitrospira moscoviensis]|uniref:cupredoxin domain-containing protein n=1 Tax=Nitrospira moscoviensis TaxID=42253 RepID=UPI001EE6D555|nr:cupredoxin domain-containing protein [Nitrospira moscoviensis]